MYQNFISEIFASYLGMDSKALLPYIPRIKAILQGTVIEDEKEPLKMAFYDQSLNEVEIPENTDTEMQDSVAIIPIRGMLTKYGSWWDYGTNDYAYLLEQAYRNDAIKAIILQIHSPGGSVHSVFPLEETLSKRNKPVLSAIDSLTMSSAYYIASLTDSIIAVNRMAELGSIGVMAMLQNNQKMLNDIGIDIIEIIPPESKWKNLAARQAIAGDTELLIKEELTPWAINFQNIVKTNRPNLDLSVEGILEGRTFYSYDAIENGLVDEILPFGEIISKAFDFETNEISKLFN